MQVCWQLWGVLLKNWYFHKSILMQSVVIYNINILVVLFSILFNSLFVNYLKDTVNNSSGGVNPEGNTDGTSTSGDNNTTNAVGALLQGYIIMATAFSKSFAINDNVQLLRVLNGSAIWKGLPDWLRQSMRRMFIELSVMPLIQSRLPVASKTAPMPH